MEYILDCVVPVKITNFRKGIFCFASAEGGEGKSYVGLLFNKLKNIGEPVQCVSSFEEFKLVKRDLRVLLVDRFDLYLCQESINIITELSKTCTVLLDIKSLNSLTKYNLQALGCSLVRTKKYIEIRLW